MTTTIELLGGSTVLTIDNAAVQPGDIITIDGVSWEVRSVTHDHTINFVRRWAPDEEVDMFVPTTTKSEEEEGKDNA